MALLALSLGVALKLGIPVPYGNVHLRLRIHQLFIASSSKDEYQRAPNMRTPKLWNEAAGSRRAKGGASRMHGKEAFWLRHIPPLQQVWSTRPVLSR